MTFDINTAPRDHRADLLVLLWKGCDIELVGSRRIEGAYGPDSDYDYLVLNGEGSGEAGLADMGFELDEPGEHYEPSGSFNSWRIGNMNVVLTNSRKFYGDFCYAQSLAEHIPLLRREERVRLFQAVLYDNFEPLTVARDDTNPSLWSDEEIGDWADEYGEGMMPMHRFAWRIYAAIIRVHSNFEGGRPCSTDDLTLLSDNGLLSSSKVSECGDPYPEYLEVGDDCYEMTNLGFLVHSAAIIQVHKAVSGNDPTKDHLRAEITRLRNQIGN